MKLSTTILPRVDFSTPKMLKHSFVEQLTLCKEAGFEVLDFRLANYTRRSSPVLDDGWQDFWHTLHAIAVEEGVTWSQGHAHFASLEKNNPEQWNWQNELTRRTIVGAGILGIKTLVFHPVSYPNAIWYSHRDSLNMNVENFRQYAEWAEPYGLTIAIENMREKIQGRRFGGGPEDLLELIEQLAHPIFGICWDTGHANISGVDQVEALRLVGPYLKALHINDNDGINDLHQLPGQGTIDWASLVNTLHQISYPGDFTFEVVNRDQSLTYGEHLKHLYRAGEALLVG